jgi:predicted PurR-regulated permease PerM
LWEEVATDVHRAVGGWVVGAFVVAIVAGTSSAITLFLLGVPYAVALGVVVGLLDPIPFVGATVGGIVAGLVAFATEGLTAGLIFAGFFLGYQQFENHVLVPLVYGRTVQLSAGAVLIAVLLGGQLAGVIGAVLAIPIAGAGKAILLDIWEWRQRQAIELPVEAEQLAAEREHVP